MYVFLQLGLEVKIRREGLFSAMEMKQSSERSSPGSSQSGRRSSGGGGVVVGVSGRRCGGSSRGNTPAGQEQQMRSLGWSPYRKLRLVIHVNQTPCRSKSSLGTSMKRILEGSTAHNGHGLGENRVSSLSRLVDAITRAYGLVIR